MLEPCLLLPLRLLRKRPVETPKATPTHRARALEPLSPISTYHAPPTVEHTHRSNCSKHAASAGARGTSPTTQIPDAWAPLSRRAWPVSTSAPAGAEHAPMPNCQRAGAAGPGGGRGESESSLARQAPWLAQPLTLRRSRGLVGQRASQRRRWATGDGRWATGDGLRATRDGRWAQSSTAAKERAHRRTSSTAAKERALWRTSIPHIKSLQVEAANRTGIGRSSFRTGARSAVCHAQQQGSQANLACARAPRSPGERLPGRAALPRRHLILSFHDYCNWLCVLLLGFLFLQPSFLVP
jgi:hypothetical protein